MKAADTIWGLARNSGITSDTLARWVADRATDPFYATQAEAWRAEAERLEAAAQRAADECKRLTGSAVEARHKADHLAVTRTPEPVAAQ